jgi:co-chaperonin GroES (HSP10)
MSEPKTIGNRATEQGEADAGADFSSINQGGPDRSSPQIEVDVKTNGLGTFLIPTNGKPVHKQASEFRMTDQDLAIAQVTDDLEVVGSPSRLAQMSKRETREQLIWYKTPAGFSAAFGKRILVRRDTLEDAYSCQTCKGTGKSEEKCRLCGATGKEGLKACRSCRVLGYGMSEQYSCGFRPCAPCRGSGWEGGIVIPEANQSAPISGIVVSVGPEVSLVKLGDRVMFSRFAGHTWAHRGGETTVMMPEHEILNLLTGNPFEL